MLTGRGHCRSLDQRTESMEEPRFGRVSRVVRDCFICFPLGWGRVRRGVYSGAVRAAKLDDGLQTPSAMELYYGVLARRKELKSRLDAAFKEVLSHAKHRRSDVLAEIAAYM
jgi:hypothetical protein